MAATKASLLRRQLGRGLGPVNPIELAVELGIRVQFVAIASLEGMYVCKDGTPVILISSLRPKARQLFTCAHEIGHHVFGHGTRVDEYITNSSRTHSNHAEEEFLADVFAGMLLMPKISVMQAFKVRGWDVKTLTPSQVYEVCNYFGVGYTTLLTHMSATLELLPATKADVLKKTPLKDIRKCWLNERSNEALTIVDNHWSHSIDLEAGELLLAPNPSVVKGSVLSTESMPDRRFSLYKAISPGLGSITFAGKSIIIRVCRKDYQGVSDYRYLGEVE